MGDWAKRITRGKKKDRNSEESGKDEREKEGIYDMGNGTRCFDIHS